MMQPAVVLVPDRTLSGDYRVLFEGIFATMQTTQVPEMVMRRFVSPKVGTDSEGRARISPLGLRRMEASLLAHTDLSASDVVCTTPEALPELLGPWVKVVAFSSSDPLGMGMSNTTTNCFCKGELYTRKWTRELLGGIRDAKQRYGFKVVAGGAGAWQWLAAPETARRFGIDTVFSGFFETKGPALFNSLIEGKDAPAEIQERGTCVDALTTIVNPSMLGIVELSRGCGKGCSFCTMASVPMQHLSEATVVADLMQNVQSGVTSCVVGSEDFFRYGSRGTSVDFEAIRSLLEQIHELNDLSFLQLDHANISSVLQLDQSQLREIRRLLAFGEQTPYLWVNLGVESADGFLVSGNSPGKIAPFRPDDWPDMVREASDRLIRCGFFPVLSIVLGLPGETPSHVRKTLSLINELVSRPLVVFPVFYEPVVMYHDERSSPFRLERMREDHFELFTTCYEQNFRYVPKLYWHNQRLGGVSWLKRMLVQVLGRSEVFSWRRKFAKIGKNIGTCN